MRSGWLMAALLIVFACEARSAEAFADDAVSLRFRFGLKDADNTDWSGKLELSGGKVQSMRGWRWMPGDKSEGNAFTVMTRRQRPQTEADRKRIAAGGKMPMTDNGFIVTLSGVKPDTRITFDAKPGKLTFKLSDLPLGSKLAGIDGNLHVERTPLVEAVAESAADEDYPSIAVGKDGAMFLVYLSFTRGKDFQGKRERPATPESGPVSGPQAAGIVRKIEKPEDLDYLVQPTGGEQIWLRVGRDGKWGEPVPVTDGKLELYRPTVTVDGSGRVWVFYSAHVDADARFENGNWELLARSFDVGGKNGGAVINISNAPGTDFMPAAATDSDGKVWITWVGARDSTFNIFAVRQDGEKFTAPMRVSQSKANEWEPSIAAGAKGQLAIAWDTYEKGDYDVHVSLRNGDSFEAPRPVAASLAYEVRPSLAYDPRGRLWIAWEQSGNLWGKDFGPLKKQGIALYNGGRSVGMKVLAPDGQWFAPADVMDAMPRPQMAARPAAGRGPQQVRNNIAPNFPKLAVGADGQVWLTFRGKPGGNWRTGVGSVWFEYVTRLSGDEWSWAAWTPRSNNILDNRPALHPAPDRGLLMAFSGDGRGEMNPAKVAEPHLEGAADAVEAFDDVWAGDEDVQLVADVEKPAEQPKNPRRPAAGAGGGAWQPDPNDDLFLAYVPSSGFGGKLVPPVLKPVPAEQPAAAPPEVQAERAAIQLMRDYRMNLNGESLRIWRGEFHRHTELSPDGGGDGGLLDMWRYAIDAAGMDWIGDGDHDYGNGREYSWWTTQKTVTLFTLPGRFTPMYCYERSVSYPEGHRNCMFAKRGVRSLPRLPLSDPEKFAPAPDTNLLYMYLKRFDGVCSSHTSATNMGTDWRNNDPLVEPFVEIYQGDRNNYERPDSPRSAVTEAKLKQSTPEKESLGGWRPKGFVNLALLKGYRLAFQSSSDHVSTHLSYCNVWVKEPTREAILDAVKKRRVYGATDNILADVCCKTGGVEHMMGEEFASSEAPTLNVKLIGTQKFNKVVIIKDDVEVHVLRPDQKEVSFTWTDPAPVAGKTSYYYVRGEQAPDMAGISSGELVWASPMWIRYQPR